MGRKFQAEDLFRIAENNLSDVEKVEFEFIAATGGFRRAISGEIPIGKAEELSRAATRRLDQLAEIIEFIRARGPIRGAR